MGESSIHEDGVFLKEAEALHNLRALEEIEKNPSISQRELSDRLGIALGITNALLKTLVRKGLIKIRGENNRSLTYHLTHAGVLAKSRLAVKWTLNTIDFYRQARQSVASKLQALAEEDVKSVVLYGLGSLTEIAAIVAPEVRLEVIGIVDGQSKKCSGSLAGYPKMRIEQLSEERTDAVVICANVDDEEVEKLGQHIEATTKLYRLI
ncbi:MAG: winged helix-turn-helix transcriptional regulator [Actinobacteria bacterium]|nr:winged helix-turn-helix transcriptional regulator [Actinomycetota bacterium]